MWGLELWQEILLWVIIFIDIFIFVKLSQLKIGRFPLIKLYWRVLIAILFPLIFVVAFMFIGVILAVALTVLFLIFLYSLLRGKTPKFRIRTF
jgi:hypothetical protein